MNIKHKKGFNGLVKVAWLADNPRKMVLLDSLVFIDSKDKVWIAAKGSLIDGASIPDIFWRIIGAPFVGYYRRASVIHDVYCDLKIESWQQTHKCFYEMMLFDGVPKWKAWLMYKAVYLFGPRW